MKVRIPPAVQLVGRLVSARILLAAPAVKPLAASPLPQPLAPKDSLNLVSFEDKQTNRLGVQGLQSTGVEEQL